MPTIPSKRIAWLAAAAASTALLAPSFSGCSEASHRVSDTFCHGENDGTPCDDGDSCTFDDRCGLGFCIGHAAPDGRVCDDGDSCTVDDECTAGVCGGLNLCTGGTGGDATVGGDSQGPSSGCGVQPNGTACDDGLRCTTQDTCRDGGCVGQALDCSDLAAACVSGVCDEATGACVAETHSDSTPCDDGDACTVGETCANASCTGATLAPTGTPCDDADADTILDSCEKGVCAGVPRPCDVGCCDMPDTTSCDDGNACTEDDACATGRCKGTAIVLDCSSLDTGCAEGACAPATGECEAQPRPAGTLCDDANPCTDTDTCRAGSCIGLMKDCSANNTACTVGICQSADGTCAQTPVTNGIPCHDGNACTGHDECHDGVCGGAVDLCGACEEKSPGDACEDGDLCSLAVGVCVQVSAGLRCEVALEGCSDVAATCAVSVCDSGTGMCESLARHETASCDDGDPCTESDHCQSCADGDVGCTDGMRCGGTLRAMCREDQDQPDDAGIARPFYCEVGADNDGIGDAVPLLVEADPLSVLGIIDGPGDLDWYAFDVDGGQSIRAVTRKNCVGSLGTVLTLVRPNGQTVNAVGASGDWATLEQRAVAGGRYHLAVSAPATIDPTEYILELTINDAPACDDQTPCTCANLGCASGGAAVGTCVPTLAVAQEPDGSTATAGALAFDAAQLGRVASASDEDWFQLQLTGGQAITLSTETACDELSVASDTAQTDTEVRLYLADGTSEVALAQGDGSGGPSARLIDYVVPQDGTYYARVSGQAGAVGAYTLLLEVGGCSLDMPCTCADQVCRVAGADPEGPGVCLPRLTAPESVNAAAAPTPLLLNQRLHSAIDTPNDVDVYELTVGEGDYDVVTTNFCGGLLDTELLVQAPGAEGLETLAEADDQDGAQGDADHRFAAVRGLSVGAARTLRITVTARGGAVGDYIIVVQPAAVTQ